MNPKPDLRSIISSLRSDAGGATGGPVLRRRVDPSCPVDVFVGTESATGHLGVLLGIHRRLLPLARDLPGGAGFALRSHVLKEDVKDIVNLGIFCTDTACEDIFLPFMDDLVSHLLAETGPEAAIKTFFARVGLWQRFFVEGRGVLLSEESQCGLFAELLMMRDLVIPAVGPPAAEAWRGPEGSPQDFVLPSCALEVKCTRAKAGGKIPISNELQLDERPFPHLVLVHVAVTMGGGNNQTLTDIVAAIRALLAASGQPLDTFNDRLITAGWIDAHADRYRENRFFVRDIHYFEVREGFPRIRPGDFPLDIADITYKIDPTAVLPFRVDRSAVEAWLKP
jgi:hypothetical protein